MEEKVKEIAECSICLDLFTDPRILPCIHTFCLKCLDETAAKVKIFPGDPMPCPLCRSEFIIPEEGMGGLKKNFFMEKLVEMTKLSKGEVSVLCQICHENNEISTATQYCIECQQHICDGCSSDHKRFKGLKEHQITPLGCTVKEDLIQKYELEFCGEHSKKKVEMYCFTCNRVICMMCFAVEHKLHDCSDIEKASYKFRLEILDNLKQIESFKDEASHKIQIIMDEETKVQRRLEIAEESIIERGKELKVIVETNINSLLDELSLIKNQSSKQFNYEKEESERYRVSIESLVMYFRELLSKGSPAEISRGVSEFRCRTEDLRNIHVLQIQNRSSPIEIDFVASKLENFSETENIVGCIDSTYFGSTPQSMEQQIVKSDISPTCALRDNDASLSSDEKSLEQILPKISRIMSRLNGANDFLSEECYEDLEFLYYACSEGTNLQKRKVGDILASLGVANLFLRIWGKCFKKALCSDQNIQTILIHSLGLMWNFTDKSYMLCLSVAKNDILRVIVNSLRSNLLDLLKVNKSIYDFFVSGLMGILHNTVQKIPESRQILKEVKAVQALQPFRTSLNRRIACVSLILQGYLIDEEENEVVNSHDSNFAFMKEVLEKNLNPDKHSKSEWGISPIEIIWGLNRVAVNDANKARIISAGILPFYVQMLQSEFSVEEQAAAAEGLGTLSLKCPHAVENEPGCIVALQSLTFSKSVRVRELAEGTLWNFEESKKNSSCLITFLKQTTPVMLLRRT